MRKGIYLLIINRKKTKKPLGRRVSFSKRLSIHHLPDGSNENINTEQDISGKLDSESSSQPDDINM